MSLTANNDDKPLAPPQASKLLGDLGYPIAPATLAQKRVHGGGPAFIKFGRRVLYKPSVLQAWISETARVQSSTSQAA
jgi:hypothetical protein